MPQSFAGSQEKHTRHPVPRRSARRSKWRPRLALESARLLYGLVLAVSPAGGAGWSGSSTDSRSRTIRQVLVLRHLAQAVLLIGAPRSAHLAGGVVDLAHAGSALWYAARTPQRRADALANAAATLLLAVAEFR